MDPPALSLATDLSKEKDRRHTDAQFSYSLMSSDEW